MKLIDRDKIIMSYRVVNIPGEGSYNAVLEPELLRAEVIDAIPTRWIEKKITEYIISNRYGSDAVPIVYALLSDWRKENAGILQRD